MEIRPLRCHHHHLTKWSLFCGYIFVVYFIIIFPEPCQNLHASCGVTRGWKEKHCTTGRNTATIQLYCPLLCGMCGRSLQGYTYTSRVGNNIIVNYKSVTRNTLVVIGLCGFYMIFANSRTTFALSSTLHSF